MINLNIIFGYFIKEQKMTEPIFEIVNKKKRLPPKQKEHNPSSYQNLYQTYISISYGYYTELFLKRIIQKAESLHQCLLHLPLRKQLRQVIKKYMMTDLQIIFFAYFAQQHQWNFNHYVINQASKDKHIDNQNMEINKIKYFIHFICFFVKTYVGNQQQVSAIVEELSNNMQGFLQAYKIWVDQNPKRLFQMSPRQLNQIYTQHSQKCGKKVFRKDHNQMVDKILDLSTTYSIMPTKQKQRNQKKSEKNSSRQQINYGVKRTTRNSDLLFFQQKSRLQYGQSRLHKKQSIILSGISFPMIQSPQKVCHMGQNVQQPRKVISLKQKKKPQLQINQATKNFFINKSTNEPINDRDLKQNNLSDFNMLSDKIQNMPPLYRNGSNMLSNWL